MFKNCLNDTDIFFLNDEAVNIVKQAYVIEIVTVSGITDVYL